MEKIEPTHYQIPANIMEQVFKFLSNYPWYQVNDIINLLRTNAQAVSPSPISKTAKEIPVKIEENPS